MGQKIGKTGKDLPVRRCGGKAMIEAGIDHEIVAHGIGRRPQIADRISVCQRTRLAAIPTRDDRIPWWTAFSSGAMRGSSGIIDLHPHFGVRGIWIRKTGRMDEREANARIRDL